LVQRFGIGAAVFSSGGVIVSVGMGQLVVVAAVVVLLFGRGRISGLMSELGSGISAFRKGVETESAPLTVRHSDPADVKHEERS
jgi:sec-independent protein translocase protein TatA